MLNNEVLQWLFMTVLIVPGLYHDHDRQSVIRWLQQYELQTMSYHHDSSAGP